MRIFPLLAAAALAASPASAAETPKEPARAGANLASYVSNDDYPAEAIRNREQGTVRFRLTIGTDGRVSNCTIFASSGSASLDSTTCRILTERTRFSPATDAEGKPTTDTVTAAIRWVLPETGAGTHAGIQAALQEWASCLVPHAMSLFADRARSTADIAEAVFPACRAREEAAAAVLNGTRSLGVPGEEEARAATMRSVRGAMVEYLEHQRKRLNP